MGSEEPDLTAVASPPRRELTYAEVDPSEDRLVGQGGQARVYEVPLGGTPDRVAVKEPLRSRTLDRTAVEEFLGEAETWLTLDARERRKPRWEAYEHVVGIVDTGDERPWIAMEYMDGGTLAERLADAGGGLPLEEALWIGECVCRGLELAHSYGIAHLDLKPENVLFRATDSGWDVPKIADWGLARVLFEHSGSMDAMSVRFGAPEQFEPEEFGDPDTLTDVYQAGVLVYTLLTGDPPYTGSRLSLIRRVLDAEPPPLPGERRGAVPKRVDRAVTDALATDKRDRLPTVTDLKRALRRARTADGGATSGFAVETTRRPEPDDGAGNEEDRDRGTDRLVALTDLDGIGPAYAGQLADHGVETVTALAEADPESLRAIDGVSLARSSEWVASAREAAGEYVDTTDIWGIGDAYAERLAAIGVASAVDLAGADPERIQEAASVDAEKATDWIRQARRRVVEAAEDGPGELTDLRGVGEARATALERAGIETAAAVVEAGATSIAERTSLGSGEAARIVGAALETAGVDADPVALTAGVETTPESLTDVRGIGDERARTLERVGIGDPAELAAADPERVAEQTELSANVVRKLASRVEDDPYA